MIILASRSPRRRDLLEMMGIPHRVAPVDVDETRRPNEPPVDYVSRLAEEKALAGAREHPGAWVLGADTIVVRDGEMLGKPASPEEAEAMLAKLSGARHVVHTAVALARDDTAITRHDHTAVWFRPRSPDRIKAYVATGEPLDKAGAYGAQGLGAVLVERIEGDYFGVIGLPVRLVADLMEEAGLPYTLMR